MGAVATAFFGGTAAVYTVAAIAHLLFVNRPEWENLARWTTRGAWIFHTVALMVLVARTGRVPVYTLFEVAFAITWLLVMNYLLFELSMNNQAAGAFLMPMIFFLVVGAMALPKPGGEEATVEHLPASLVFWHVSVAILGYIFFVASSVAGGMYLLLDRLLRRKAFSPMYYRLPSLEALDIWGHRFVAVGWPLLTLGLVAGIIFAELIWGSLWALDAKVAWSVLTWLFYGAYLVRRKTGGLGGRVAARWSIAGLGCLLINYFLITYLSSLHRFGV